MRFLLSASGTVVELTRAAFGKDKEPVNQSTARGRHMGCAIGGGSQRHGCRWLESIGARQR